MNKSSYEDFNASFQDAIVNVSDIVLGIELKKCDAVNEISGKKFCAVIGIVGGSKGRVRLEVCTDTVKKIAENMNGDSSCNTMDTYMCFSELTNMICGNAITSINNKYRGMEMRLTPPAIFSGDNMRVVAPGIYSTVSSYDSEYGKLFLEIGFEGVC